MIFELTKMLAIAILIDLAACATLEEPVEQRAPRVEVEPAMREPLPEPEARVDEAPAGTKPLLLPRAGTNIVGELREVIARPEDTLPDLARQFDLGYKEIIAANPQVDPMNPVVGTRIVLPTQFILPTAPRVGAVLNISESRLYYYPRQKDGEPAVVITHPIAVGRENLKIPVGASKVAEKTYNPTSSAIVSKTASEAAIRDEHRDDGSLYAYSPVPGPDHRLTGELRSGARVPSPTTEAHIEHPGIGARLGGSCIQLYPEDMQNIFDQIPVGTPLRIVDQPYLIGRRDGMIYLKAREARTRYRSNKPDLIKLRETVRREVQGKVSVDWNKVGNIAKEARGIPIPILTGSSNLTELLSAAPMVSVRARSFIVGNDFPSKQSTARCPQIKVAYAHGEFEPLMLCACLEGRSTSPDQSANRLNKRSTPVARPARPMRNPVALEQEISRVLAEGGLNTVQVKVDRDLSVTLLGSVDESAKKTQALRLVRLTPGVKSVKDLLTVVKVH